MGRGKRKGAQESWNEELVLHVDGNVVLQKCNWRCSLKRKDVSDWLVIMVDR
jgi:hypothetical protein